MTRFSGLAALLALVLSCAGGDKVDAPPAIDAGQRRAHAPPVGLVRAYPPHAIRSDGVGPYLLGEPLADVLRVNPEGPRLELLQIARWANWKVVRSDGGALMIGAPADAKSEVAFIAVLKPEIARTTTGVGVGASGADLLKALGRERVRADVARDRRIYELEALPNVRFLTDSPVEAPPEKTKVIAVLVAREPPESAPEEPRSATCRTSLAQSAGEVAAVARGKSAGGAPAPVLAVRFGCFSAAAPEAVVELPGEVVLVGGEPGKLRRLGALAVPNGALLAAVDLDGDGKDEVVFVDQKRAEKEHAVELRIIKWDGAKLVEAQVERPYVVGETAAAAVGATPADVDIAVEVRPVRGALQVSGLYLARSGSEIREAAPLAPVQIRLEPRRPPSSMPSDAGAGDQR